MAHFIHSLLCFMKLTACFILQKSSISIHIACQAITYSGTNSRFHQLILFPFFNESSCDTTSFHSEPLLSVENLNGLIHFIFRQIKVILQHWFIIVILPQLLSMHLQILTHSFPPLLIKQKQINYFTALYFDQDVLCPIRAHFKIVLV